MPPALEVSVEEGVQQFAVNFGNDPYVVFGFFTVAPVPHPTIRLQLSCDRVAYNCLTPFTLDAAFQSLVFEVL